MDQKKDKKPSKAILVLSSIIGVGLCVLIVIQFYYISWNFSPSLPYTMFVVEKRGLPQKGGFVVFNFPGKQFYNPKDRFVKKVVGVPGDRVEVRGREVFLNGESVAVAKEKSVKGIPLAQLNFNGVIPEGKLFVLGMTKDSYDSRYEDVGLVDQNRIIWTGHPVF